MMELVMARVDHEKRLKQVTKMAELMLTKTDIALSLGLAGWGSIAKHHEERYAKAYTVGINNAKSKILNRMNSIAVHADKDADATNAGKYLLDRLEPKVVEEKVEEKTVIEVVRIAKS